MSESKKNDIDLSELGRRKLRYWCFRCKTELEGGADVEDMPKGLKKHLEKMTTFSAFSGWEYFGVKWDWTEAEPYEMIPLQIPLMEQWEKECEANAKVFPAELMAKLQAKKDAETSKIRPPVKDITIDAFLPKGGGEAKVVKRNDGEQGDV